MIKTEAQGAVTVLTIDRPERRNALDAAHCDALGTEVEKAAADGARALVITGAGTSFCAGADFNEVYGTSFRDSLYVALRRIREVPTPVIAAVNGPAIGAGTQLAIACDMRVADDTASFGVPTAQLGLAVDPWTIRRLASLAGASVASSLVLGCDRLDADAAALCGLVNRRGDQDAALAWAAELAALAPLTLAYSKRVLHELAAGDATEQELVDAFARCWSSDDLKEGQLARAEKRAPRFRGV